jgi:hypothetical protein
LTKIAGSKTIRKKKSFTFFPAERRMGAVARAVLTGVLALVCVWSIQMSCSWNKNGGSVRIRRRRTSNAPEVMEESVRPQEYETTTTSPSPNDDKSTTLSTTSLVSILLMAIAGTILLGASLLYAQDLYNRFCGGKKRKRRRPKPLVPLEPDEADACCDDNPLHSQADNDSENDNNNALFRIRANDDDNSSSFSLSRVSSMTDSLVRRDHHDHLDGAFCCYCGNADVVVAGLDQLEEGIGMQTNDTKGQNVVDGVTCSDQLEVDSSVAGEKGTHGTVSSTVTTTPGHGKGDASQEQILAIASSLDDTDEPHLTVLHTRMLSSGTIQPFARTETQSAVVEWNKTMQSLKGQAPALLVVCNGTDEERDVEFSRQMDRPIRTTAGADDMDSSCCSMSLLPEADCIRDIYLASTTIAGGGGTTPIVWDATSLGISLQDSMDPDSHPFVTLLSADSPLQSTIFLGDCILSINDQDAAGFCADQVNRSMGTASESSDYAVKMIKLTVMSLHSDRGSECSTVTPAEPASKGTGALKTLAAGRWQVDSVMEV